MTIILETVGDIFESKMQTLVCPVNAVGAMGAGLAKQFKERYPDYFEAYRRACLLGVAFRREKCFVYDLHDGHKAYSMLTKWYWRYPSNLQWINNALHRLTRDIETYGITSIAIPAVGCGKGQLEWGYVKPMIYDILGPLKIDVEVYAPFGENHEAGEGRTG